MKCTKKAFGTTKNGEEVFAYTLTNKHDHAITILNLGGIIQKLIMPDRNGVLANIVDGHDNVANYENHSPYFGCITGRIAGRISGAAFTIGEETYTLAKNDGNNNLHGGPVGLDKVIWEVSESMTETYGDLSLHYTSYDMDQGFPGTVDMVVTYRFDDDDTLTLTYKATTDKDTILTLTNHTYFNLSGDLTTTILDHDLKIPADQVIFVNDEVIPTALVATKNTPFDFTVKKAIGKEIGAADENLKNAGGYDHAFLLNKTADETIELSDPKSGRTLTMTTTEPCVVCYTGNFMTSDMFVYDGVKVQKNGAVCLETQYYPNAINADFFETKLLKPGQLYKEKTVFKFSVN